MEQYLFLQKKNGPIFVGSQTTNLNDLGIFSHMKKVEIEKKN